MDFTLSKYLLFLKRLTKGGYSSISLSDYLNNKSVSFTFYILRHDVDRNPMNSLKMAKLEKELGIKGTYYFRIVPESFDEDIIKEIENMGHEIGYHYEEMDVVSSKFGVQRSEEELIDNAWELFTENLDKIRKIADVKTICAHGSPLSPFENKTLWAKYDYKALGIIADAHLDTDWNQFAYFTDTGRRWNGTNVSVRDKVKSNYNFNFKSTFDIINNLDKLPDKVMFNIHPERWNDKFVLWMGELIGQNFKNVVKKYFFVNKSK